MARSKDNRLMVAILLFALIICSLIWYFRTSYFSRVMDYRTAESAAGVWDLTDIDFDRAYVRLNGDVTYVPGAALTPAEFAAWPGEKYTGSAESRAGYATSLLRIFVPEDGLYMLVGTSIDFTERIYVNGEWRQDVGVIGSGADDNVPGFAYLRIEARAVDGVIEIVRQGANYVHREGGGHAGLYIGRPDVMRQFADFDTYMAVMTMGLFLALFLLHLSLYFILQVNRANLYFALFCLTWFFRTGVTGPKIITQLFPAVSWYVIFRVEYICIPLAGVFVILLLRELLPDIPNPLFVRIALVLSALFAVLCVGLNTLWLSYALLGYYLFYSLCILYVFVRTVRILPGMIRRGQMDPEHWAMLCGMGVFMVAALHDALYYCGIYLHILPDTPLTDVALLFFTFCQMNSIFYGSVRQIMQAREAEHASRMEAEAMRYANRMKERFMGNLFHELRLPLTVISGFAQLTDEMLDDDRPDPDRLRANMRHVVEETDRMESLVEMLSETDAINSGRLIMQMTSVDMAELIRRVEMSHYAHMNENGNRMIVDIAPGLPPCRGDGDRLLQVLINLISNASKHTVTGTVTVSAGVREDELVIAVSDTGSGIEPDLLRELFRHYPIASRSDGMGLGLHICETIVSAHGGHIDIASKPGEGTRVCFTVPVDRTAEVTV